jgi:hypothetical protein
MERMGPPGVSLSGTPPWDFGWCCHTTFAELANAFIEPGRFDEAVAAARKSLRKSQGLYGGLLGADSAKTRSASAHIYIPRGT